MAKRLTLKNPDVKLPNITKISGAASALGLVAVFVAQWSVPGVASVSAPEAVAKVAAPENMTVAGSSTMSDVVPTGTTIVQHYGVPMAVFLITVGLLVAVQIAVLVWYVRQNSVKVKPSTRLVAVGWQKLDAQEAWKIANFAEPDIQEELVVTLAAGDDEVYAADVAKDASTARLLDLYAAV